MGKDRRTRRAERAASRPASRTRERVAPLVGATHTTARDRRLAWLIAIALAVVTAVVYAAVRSHDFVTWDDPNYIKGNPQVLQGLTSQGVWWAFTTSHPPYWHPLTWISHMLDIQMFGLWAGGHLLTNVAFHIVSTLVLLFWLWKVTGELGKSAFVAGLFALHPLHVESVAWVAERKDVLSTLLWILTLVVWIAYVRRPSWLRYATVIVVFAAGLMAKSMLVTLPVVLLLIDVWPLGRAPLSWRAASDRATWRRLAVEKLPLLAMGIVSSIVTMRTAPAGSMGSLELLPASLRIENAVVSYGKYLGKMLWPVDLAALYPLHRSIPLWQVVVSLAVLAAISLVVVRQARRRPYLAVGWAWYLVTLVPVIGFTQSGDQALADRFMYVPSIGLSIMAAWGLPDLLSKWSAREIALRATAVLALAACAMVSRHQVGYWTNSYILWGHTLDVTSNNHRAENNLANELMDQGRLAEALLHYENAERLEPVFADAHNGRGSVLAAEGKVNEAIAEYREALRLKPDHAQTHNNLGNTYYNGGQYDNALKEYAEAARLAPEMAEAHNGLGAVHAARGDTEGALREFEISLRLKPDADVFYNVATMHVQAGRTAEARTALQRALALNPQHADAKRLLATLR